MGEDSIIGLNDLDVLVGGDGLVVGEAVAEGEEGEEEAKNRGRYCSLHGEVGSSKQLSVKEKKMFQNKCK